MFTILFLICLVIGAFMLHFVAGLVALFFVLALLFDIDNGF